MNKKLLSKSLSCILLLLAWMQCSAQLIASFEVKLKTPGKIAIPVYINLDEITFLPDSVLQLFEIHGKLKIPVPIQIEMNGHRNLNWIINPSGKGKQLNYELVAQKSIPDLHVLKTVMKDGALTISAQDRNLLRYNYKTVYPPEGIDSSYRRSGFIHPLWSPRGQELTRINAPDHYHHWGLWNPWTEVLFENDSVDFWNLARKQGTVRFHGFASVTEGNVFAGYEALHEHVVFKKNGEQKVALNELQSVKIFQPSGHQNYYIADITIQLSCASASPVLLLEYRYGGLGLRATKDWDSSNSRIITSEGKSRREADGSRARWVMVQGKVSGDSAGLVMMSYPANYNHPEPLRVWPENMNRRGDVFLNFSPTKNMNWLISPGNVYLLRYRLLVFNDDLTKENAEQTWQNYVNPPEITIRKNAKQ